MNLTKVFIKAFLFPSEDEVFHVPRYILSGNGFFFFMMSFYQIVLFYNLSQTRQNSPLKILKRSCRRRSLRKRRENTLYASRSPKLGFLERKVKAIHSFSSGMAEVFIFWPTVVSHKDGATHSLCSNLRTWVMAVLGT